MFVHKTMPQLGARTHEWVGPKRRSEHGLELYSQDTDWAGHLHIPFNYTNWASKNKSKADGGGRKRRRDYTLHLFIP